MSKLQNTYAAAVAKFGNDLPLAIARAFGGVAGVDDVPISRRDGLTAALNRVLIGEGHISMAMAKAAAHGDARPKRDVIADQDEVFRAIRAEAFGANEDDDDDSKPVAQINPREIYSRWNASKRPNED
ncbi:hypothetical protein JQ574_28965 [Bradyrhizobium sp. AUGA SZCCT0158]|uniref:hypothetical protein n=1 Tax=Bradyrhizobium sp. AUGA SZCCT0158 TaxID=2807661 RepID=UPI001BAA4F8E|nr:hypothetical protein [Bradyrhizobium sp. AUGA SZCCT0158]MBR1200029.1 hypothetical protein [Bradyrhizobium sp. AUGA SZCCT0158]